MKIWYTSDYHLGHANIIEYCNRPFKNLEHMNETIIRNHNQRVSPEDTVIHVGDFCFRNSNEKRGEGVKIASHYWESRLNGKIIHVKGNHDKNNGVKTVIESMIIHTHGETCFVTHNPENYRSEYKINLVGHVHTNWKITTQIHTPLIGGDPTAHGFVVNVGVDQWKFMPISFEEILAGIKTYVSKK